MSASVRLVSDRKRKDAVAWVEANLERYVRRGFSLRIERDVRRTWEHGPKVVMWDVIADPRGEES